LETSLGGKQTDRQGLRARCLEDLLYHPLVPALLPLRHAAVPGAHPGLVRLILTRQRQLMLINEISAWFPEHIKHGRFTVGCTETGQRKPRPLLGDGNADMEGNDSSAIAETPTVTVRLKRSLAATKNQRTFRRRTWQITTSPGSTTSHFDINMERRSYITSVTRLWTAGSSGSVAQLHLSSKNKEKFEATFRATSSWSTSAESTPGFTMCANEYGAVQPERFKNVITAGIVAGND